MWYPIRPTAGGPRQDLNGLMLRFSQQLLWPLVANLMRGGVAIDVVQKEREQLSAGNVACAASSNGRLSSWGTVMDSLLFFTSKGLAKDSFLQNGGREASALRILRSPRGASHRGPGDFIGSNAPLIVPVVRSGVPLVRTAPI